MFGLEEFGIILGDVMVFHPLEFLERYQPFEGLKERCEAYVGMHEHHMLP